MGGDSSGVHTKGWQTDVVKRRMEKEVRRAAEQDLQVGLDPGERLEAGGRSTKLLEGKCITREFSQHGGC